jgi:hypothetical protein
MVPDARAIYCFTLETNGLQEKFAYIFLLVNENDGPNGLPCARAV